MPPPKCRSFVCRAAFFRRFAKVGGPDKLVWFVPQFDKKMPFWRLSVKFDTSDTALYGSKKRLLPVFGCC